MTLCAEEGLTTEFDLAYQPGMLAADVWVAGVRQHAYTARPSSIYGKAVRRMVVEEKDYPTTLRLHLSAAIADLPSSLDSDADRDAYYDFLVTLGTHYILKEVFGGLIEWQVFVGKATSQAVPALEDTTQRVFDRLLSSIISEAMAGAAGARCEHPLDHPHAVLCARRDRVRGQLRHLGSDGGNGRGHGRPRGFSAGDDLCESRIDCGAGP